MSKIVFVYSIYSLFVTTYQMPSIGVFGPGKWSVQHIKRCPGDGVYLFQFDILRHKVNRSHDAFYGEIRAHAPLDASYAMRLEICKHVDGGCKPYREYKIASFCGFVERHAKENIERAFVLAGIPLPLCPVSAGTYHLPDYMFDYSGLHANSAYGVYDGRVVVTDAAGAAAACVDVTVSFDREPRSDSDDDR